jgi:hypothetical protein
MDRYELMQKIRIGDALYDGAIDTWDYQWAIIKAFNGGINVIPDQNLVQNIGIGPGATHTKHADKSVPKVDKLFRIEFPMKDHSFPIPSCVYDALYANKHFHPEPVLKRLMSRVITKMNSLERKEK